MHSKKAKIKLRAPARVKLRAPGRKTEPAITASPQREYPSTQAHCDRCNLWLTPVKYINMIDLAGGTISG